MGQAAPKDQKSTTSTLLIICSEHEKVGWSDNHKTASAEIESFVITLYQSDNFTVHSMPFSIQAFKLIRWNFVENVRANAEGDVMRSFFFFLILPLVFPFSKKTKMLLLVKATLQTENLRYQHCVMFRWSSESYCRKNEMQIVR